ncbi:MAG: glycerate kinase [Candidatus Hydrogenedentes bacterium]|nr:glycerate kinase [Candidatus Hydrogenedentota bacterium]
MRIVIAPDSYKECASAVVVAQAIAEGWRRAAPEAELKLIPMADGGEGTVETLVAATSGNTVSVTVTGPLGSPVEAVYGVLGDGKTAIIEMASASGLALVPPAKRDPCITTTFGTGELMRHALTHGVQRIIIGLGGSATNDGGAGMAQALGYSLRDAAGVELPWGGAALERLAAIDSGQADPRLKACDVLIACDVSNPLCGESGASQIYGPQKGATPDSVEQLDSALRHFGNIVERELGAPILTLAGGGAAGGLGAGLAAFAHGVLKPGVDIVADACGLDDAVRGAQLVITGEGRLDHQSAHGKTPVGVARIAKRYGIPVIAIAGSLGEGCAGLRDLGIDAAFSICPSPMTLTDAMARAPELIADLAESIARVWRASVEHPV